MFLFFEIAVENIIKMNPLQENSTSTLNLNIILTIHEPILNPYLLYEATWQRRPEGENKNKMLLCNHFFRLFKAGHC